MTTEAWLPAELSDVLSASALRETPLYELLSDADVVVDRMQHEVTAEIAGHAMQACSMCRSGLRRFG